MKTKALKFVRKNLELYDGHLWIVKPHTVRPLLALLLCQELNLRRFYLKEYNDAKRDFKLNFKKFIEHE